VRTCDLGRARAAAEKCLRGVERFRADAPSAAEASEAAEGRAQLHASIVTLLGKASMGAASKFGAHWIIEEKEAIAIATPTVEVIELELGSLPDDPWSKLYIALGMVIVPRLIQQFLGKPAEPAPAAAPATSPVPTSTIDTTATVRKEAAA
jgi:hypothetical protein